MGDISTPAEAWDKVMTAARTGQFVPVLGPEVAADPMYTQAPPSVLADYGQDEDLNASQQERELRAISLHQGLLADRLRCGTNGLSRDVFWPNLPRGAATGSEDRDNELDREKLAEYIEQLSWQGAIVSSRDENRKVRTPSTPAEQVYEDFLCDIALLALSLKRAWYGSLMNDASPLSALGPDHVIDDDGQLDDQSSPEILQACLESCRRLLEARKSGAWKEPLGLRLRWVYCKLLLLGSQVFGDHPRRLWVAGLKWMGVSSVEFVARHAPMIRDHGPRQTGWELRSSIPEAKSIAHGLGLGLRQTHVLWVESLVRHALLAGTRAYRTSGQLAFLLSLDNKVTDLPSMYVDPFEAGLLRARGEGASIDEGDLGVLKRLYDHAEKSTAPDGLNAPRLPGAFHQAIARIVHAMSDGEPKATQSVAKGKKKTGFVSTGPGTSKAVILTMALDTEMERALEQLFDCYRVLVPVSWPLRGTKKLRYQTWVLGEFRRTQNTATGRPTFRCEGWTPVTDPDKDDRIKADVEGNGPLLIKLFGSPLADLGTSEQYALKYDLDVERDVQPRVVLDESELLRLLKKSIPEQVHGLRDKFKCSRLFFFGQNAVKWSDRIPYLMVDALRKEGETTTSEKVGAGGEIQKDGPPLASIEPSLVAFAERSEYGDSLFARLNVTHNSGDVGVTSIVRAIMEGVVYQGIGRDSDAGR